MKILINKIQVETKISIKTGKPYHLQKYTYETDEERRVGQIFINSEKEAYPVGLFVIHQDSYRMNDFGNLEIGFLKFQQVKPS
ncbi:MAG: single-stranded DNA-binding protein [Flavobacteriaceae bacterium]